MELGNKEVKYFMSIDTSDAVLHTGDKELPCPLVKSTEGSNAYDISKLLKETGNVTLDPGFVNTASCSSAITYIDGDAGILRYRGYPIEQLAENSTFLETSHLLIYGELPTAVELADFDSRIRRHTLLHEDLRSFFGGFPRDAHPMPVLSSAVSALSTFYQDSLDRAPDGQAADDRGVRVQEERGSAVPVSGQLDPVGGELPADDVWVPGRAV
jgi:citrate synthase